MQNLRTAPCCHSCKHCAVTCEQDEGPEYWCNLTGAFKALNSARQEFYMDDPPFEFEGSRYWSLEDLLDAVTKPYAVSPSEICDHYEPLLWMKP